MYPPIFATCYADSAVQNLLGSDPLRLYPFGENSENNQTAPYAVWQTLSGSPENYIDKAPDIDVWTIQVDVYAATIDSVRDAAEALRDAIQTVAHITFWNGDGRDPDTNLYRFTFTVDWWVTR